MITKTILDSVDSPDANLISAKAAHAYRTISETAILMDVPQHVLRFWETKFPEIKPLKRSGGRRFYNPEAIEVLRMIKHLLYKQGYTIRGVQQLLKQTRGGKDLEAVAPKAQPKEQVFVPAAKVASPAPHTIDPEKVMSLQAMAGKYGLDPETTTPPQLPLFAQSKPTEPEAPLENAVEPAPSTPRAPQLSQQKREKLLHVLSELRQLQKLVETQRG